MSTTRSAMADSLLEAVRQAGAEGVVSKRLGSLYRGRGSRDWLKTKCHETGVFVITGFQELGEGRLEALFVAEERDGALCLRRRSASGSPARGCGTSLIVSGPDLRARAWCRSSRCCRRTSSSSAATDS